MNQTKPTTGRQNGGAIPIISLLGALVFSAGVGIVGFYWLVYSPTVDGVYNVGLMQNRQLGVVIGLALALVGLAGAAFGYRSPLRGPSGETGVVASDSTAGPLTVQRRTIARALMGVGGLVLVVLLGLGFRSSEAPLGTVAGIYVSVNQSESAPTLNDWEFERTGDINLVETGDPQSSLPFGRYEVRSSMFGGTSVLVYAEGSKKPLFLLKMVRTGLLGDAANLWRGSPLYLMRDPINYDDEAKDVVYTDLRRKDLKGARDSFEMHVLHEIETRVKEGSLTPAQGAVATVKRWMQFVHLLHRAVYTGSMFSDSKPSTSNDPFEAEAAKMEQELLVKAAPALKLAIEGVTAEEKRLR